MTKSRQRCQYFQARWEKIGSVDGTRDGNNLAVRGEKSHSSHGLPAKVRIDRKKKNWPVQSNLSKLMPSVNDVAMRVHFFFIKIKFPQVLFQYDCHESFRYLSTAACIYGYLKPFV